MEEGPDLQSPPMDPCIHADVSNGARSIKFGRSLHIH